MTITLPSDIESALLEQARQHSTSPEALELDNLKEIFVTKASPHTITLREPQDDWERLLRSAASPAGVSLTDEQVISEGVYQESLAEEAVLEKLALAPKDTQGYDLTPRDDWERLVLGMGIDAGVSLTDEQLSREVMCEDHD